MKPTDHLTDQEHETLALLQECAKRIRDASRARTQTPVTKQLTAGDRLNATCKALIRKLPDFMW